MQTRARPASVLTHQIVYGALLITSLCICHEAPAELSGSTQDSDCQFDVLVRHGSRTELDRGWARDLRRALEKDDSECGVAIKANNQAVSDSSSPIGTNRILNGRQTEVGQLPWVVKLRLYRKLRLKGSCTASIVTNRHVLTAAHCLTECSEGKTLISNPKQVSALAGRVNIDRWTLGYARADIEFAKIIVPANYDACQARPSQDFAVLVADKPMELRSPQYPNSNISRVCLPESYVDIRGKTCVMAGWGEVSYGAGPSKKLMWARAEIEDTCFDQDVFCSLGRDSVICKGDSGGPVTIELTPGKWTQVGIITSYDGNMGNCTNGVRMFFNGAMIRWTRIIYEIE